MAKTDAIDPNVPSGGETPRQGDDRIRTLAKAVAELLNVDHYMGTDGGADTGYNEDAAGEHTRIKFNAPLDTDPTNATNKGFLYTKDAASKAELFWQDEDGNIIQLTSAGQLNPSLACLLTGNQTVGGIKTFTSPVINTSISGSAVLDEDTMSSDSDTKLATQQSIKAYVDGWGQVCRMYRDASLNLTTLGWHAFDCDTDSYDPDNISNTSNGRITPSKAGYYQVNVGSYIGNAVSGTLYGAAIYKNGYPHTIEYFTFGQGSESVVVSDIVYCNGTTDCIEAYLYNGHVSDTAVVAGSPEKDFLSIARVAE